MKLILLIAAGILIIIGAIFGFAYIRRKEQKFDEKCNNYFIVSTASLIVAATFCIIEIVMVIASLI